MKRIINQVLVIAGLIFLVASCEKAPFVTMTGPRSFTFTQDGGTQSFSFTCNRDWSVSSSESWIRVSPSSGCKSDNEVSVTITCSPNTTYDPRNATITVRVEELTETISVTQETGLGLLVSPTTFDLTNAAQDIEIEVQKNVQYSVTIDEACKSWISQKGTKALSSEKVTFSVAANDSYDNREGKITFKQTDGDLVQTVTVRQSQTNGLFITTPEYDLSNEAHTLTVEVKANVEYDVTSTVDWIKYTSAGTKALPATTFTLEVAANETYDKREGKVTVKQKNGDLTGVITIRQDQNYGLFLSEESVSISKEAQSVSVVVKYNVDFSVIIPAEAQGTMITTYSSDGAQTKALESTTYKFEVSENKTYDPREASITFKQKDGSLSGTFKITQAQSYGLSVSKKQFDLQPAAGTFKVTVSANVPYTVDIQNASWIERTETKGLTDEEVVFNYSANEETADRSATIIISSSEYNLSEEIKVTQYGAGYYKGDVVLMSDADVADFNARSVKVIDGDLIIKNTGGISNLVINNQLQKVLGTVQIEGENIGISGLENLTYVHSIRFINCSLFSIFKSLSEIPGDFYYSYLEPNITDFKGLEWLTKVEGDLSIISPDSYSGMGKIVNFKGFDNLVEVGGSLAIQGFFNSLSSFNGFNKLEKVGGDLKMYCSGYNCFPLLNNFSGFDLLESIGGSFIIGCGMRNVANFGGLESLRSIGGDIRFRDNWGRGSLLSSLTSFKGLDNLEEIGGVLFTGGGISGPIPLQSFSALKSLKKIGGLQIPDAPNLDVNSFSSLPINHIGEKGVWIMSNMISDLYFLKNIEKIDGFLKASGSLIRNWKGLINLKEVGELYIGSHAGYYYSTPSCEGLESVERVGSLYVGGTDSSANQIYFDNLKGLENLRTIDYKLCIENTTMSTIEDLKSLQSIGSEIDKTSNDWIIYICNNSLLSKYSALKPALQSLLDSGKYGSASEIQNKCSVYNNKYNPTVEQILSGKGDQ